MMNENDDDLKKLTHRDLLLLNNQKLNTLNERFQSLENSYNTKIMELEVRLKTLEVKAALWGTGAAAVVTIILKYLFK
jgi:uncharacterized coiled-coil protein SlyX